MSKRTAMETVEFDIAKSQCDTIREISGVEPAYVAIGFQVRRIGVFRVST